MESLTGVFDKGVNTRKILIATLTATIGGFLFGYDIGVVGPALVYLTPFFHLTTIETAFVGSGIFLTAFFAAIINGKLADEYGRKKLLIMDGVIFLIFAIFTALSVNATMVIIGRLAIGVALGTDAISTAYISEFTPKARRGRFSLSQQIMVELGITISFAVSFALISFIHSTDVWRWMFALGAVPAAILLGLRVFMPESPRWLLKKGDEKKLAESLSFFGVDANKYKEMMQTVNDDRTRIKKKFSVSDINAIKITSLWEFFLQYTGVNVVLFYSALVFVVLGFSGHFSILSNVFVNAIAIIFLIISLYFIDKWGRVRLGIIGFSGTAVGMAISAVGSYMLLVGDRGLGIIFLLGGILIFYSLFSFGVGGVGWVIRGEVIPSTQNRGYGTGILSSVAFISSFSLLFIFPIWKEYLGLTSFYVFVSIMSVIAVLYVKFILPEVKGKSVEEMNYVFKEGFWKAKKDSDKADKGPR